MLSGIRTGVSGSPADRGQDRVVSVISSHTQKGWKCHIVALTLPPEEGWQGITWHQWREWTSIKQVNSPSVGLLMFSRKMGNKEKWEKGCNDPRFSSYVRHVALTYSHGADSFTFWELSHSHCIRRRHAYHVRRVLLEVGDDQRVCVRHSNWFTDVVSENTLTGWHFWRPDALPETRMLISFHCLSPCCFHCRTKPVIGVPPLTGIVLRKKRTEPSLDMMER